MTKEEFDSEISKRDQEIVSLKSRLQLTEVNFSLTQVVVHAIQEQLAALSTPLIPSSKDNGTEGEKKTQENSIAVAGEKGNELAVVGESSFSLVLEEGEIDETYVPEYVEGVFSAEKFTSEEAQVDEEDELADEYAFHNDCLFNGIDEVISLTIPVAQDFLKRKLERVRMFLERKEKEKDVIPKEGSQWDETRILFNKKELTLEKNEDMVVLDHIRELQSQYPNIHTFYESFADQVTSFSVSAQNSGWMMYINFKDSESKLLSTKSFKKMNIVDLFVLMRKVIKGG